PLSRSREMGGGEGKRAKRERLSTTSKSSASHRHSPAPSKNRQQPGQILFGLLSLESRLQCRHIELLHRQHGLDQPVDA
ncbi:hypothetical protein ABTE74_23230, partial [Acinetobacter baumannii]